MHTNICLIGSTKFESVFRKLEEDLSMRGYIVLSPLVYTQSGEDPKCGKKEKEILDLVQKEKIRQSDIVFVVDVDGYVGNSTKNQIKYAKLLNKPLLYYSKGDLKKIG